MGVRYLIASGASYSSAVSGDLHGKIFGRKSVCYIRTKRFRAAAYSHTFARIPSP